MEHPSRETWMEWLYGETAAGAKRELREHLDACPECRAQVDGWKLVGLALDEDKAALALPRRQAPRVAPVAALRFGRWAAAAALVAAGFLAGRHGTVSQREVAALVDHTRTDLQAEWRKAREEDTQAMAAVASEISARQTEAAATKLARLVQASEARNRETINAAFTTLEKDRIDRDASYDAAFQRLAEQTGAGFNATRKNLNMLASFLPSARTDSRDAGNLIHP
jgi:Putative zinc-finger